MTYDVAVAGLGGMGSAVLAHCARRGARTIGLDRFARGHDLGASAGKSRLIRQAYFEEPAYVPLVLRAYELWRELERTAGAALLRITGLLTVGEDDSEIINGTRRAAEAHQLQVETLNRAVMKQRYATVLIEGGEVALFERAAGVLNPEGAIRAHLQAAQEHGAEMRFEMALQNWRTIADGFEIQTSDGETIRSRKLVLTLGPWLKPALEALGIPIRVQRNVQAWFSPSVDAYHAARFPAFLLNRRGLPAPLYGFPDLGDGIKAAFHGWGDLTEADKLDRAIDERRDIAPLAQAMEEWMPGATAAFLEAKACMYSLTPDEHFVVDHHPQDANAILCGGFSGHGFKFAPVVGEIAADLALDGGSRHEIGFLSLRRFR